MSNKSFKDKLLKIGISNSNPTSNRKDQLFTTGVPEPFRVEYSALVENVQNIERKIHKIFNKKRARKNREFLCALYPK